MGLGSRQAWRKAWWQVHKWIGLVLMALLIPLGLTGAILAWDDAIDQLINPQRYAVHGPVTLAPSAYADAARGALRPGERIASIRYPEGEGPVIVNATSGGGRAGGEGRHGDGGAKGGRHEGGRHHGRAEGAASDQAPRDGAARDAVAPRGGPPQRVTLWLDPGNAHVLDVRRGNTGLIRVAHVIHSNFFIDRYGRALVGLLGMGMFLMALGGVWLWWPPIGSWIKGLRWQRGDRRLDTNLHHRVGFWIALPLAFQSFTGVWIAWPQMMQIVGLAPARGGGMERMMRAGPAADPALGPDQALAAARAAQPGDPAMLSWPAGKDGWRVSLDGAKGHAELNVDDATGTVSPAPKREPGLAGLMRGLHDGSRIGWGWRALMVLWGLAPTLLGITGLTMWLRGRRWRAEAAKRKRKTREPVAAG